MSEDPRTFHIEQDREGFFIADEYGDELTSWPTWDAPYQRYASQEAAELEVASMISNWEPPDPPGWEGGFADNH